MTDLKEILYRLRNIVEFPGIRVKAADLIEAQATTIERLRDCVVDAYRTGATDVHNYWANGGEYQKEPDFYEAASDYASEALAALDKADDA